MKLSTSVFCIVQGMVLLSQNTVIGTETYEDRYDANPTGPKGLRLAPGIDNVKGSVTTNDKVDCYQYYSDKRTNGYVRFLQKPAKTTLHLTGKVTLHDRTQSSCKIPDPSTNKVVTVPDCQELTFFKGTSYICVRYRGASQSKQDYELAIDPPSGPLVILDEKTALGDSGEAEIPSGVNTIVGTIGGYSGTGSTQTEDVKDCYWYSLWNPPHSAIVFKKQPKGATLKLYSQLGNGPPTPLNWTANIGHCSEGDFFDIPTTIKKDTLCASVQFSVMNLICVELQPFTKEKQQYELYLSLRGEYFDFTPY